MKKGVTKIKEHYKIETFITLRMKLKKIWLKRNKYSIK